MALCNVRKQTIYVGTVPVSGNIFWYDNNPKIFVYIPDEPIFSLIKSFVLEGNGLLDSYKKAGPWAPGKPELENLYPNDIIAMPIKFFIYDAVNYVNGQAVSRPYADGVWIHEQASSILQGYFLGALSKTGRLQLNEGVILPTQAEQTCIKNYIRNSGLSMLEAFQKCNCSEIYPAAYANQLEAIIKNYNYTLFYSYMIGLTQSTITNPEIDTDQHAPKSNYIPLILMGVALMTRD